jgi:hypothetical protein
MKLKLLLTAMSAAVCAFGQADYFPLQVGNQWIYRNPYGVQTVEITRSQVIDGREYFFLRGAFGGDAWVRKADDGTVWQRDPETGRENVRLKLNTPEGASFETVIDRCNHRGIMVSRNSKTSTPAADFQEVLEISYPAANCADAGLEREFYAPWIGLVSSSGMTIAGARNSELVYARIGGVTVLTSPELSFALSLDKAVYDGGELLARMTLRNTQPAPLRLTFSSGQTFDVLIKTEAGDKVLLWSEGKAFTLAIREESMQGERNWVATLPLRLRDGSAIAPGKYIAEAWLVTLGPRLFVASVPFEIVKP